jgi:hypothetical protein
MERIKKSRLFGFFALVACFIALNGSHYFPFFFRLAPLFGFS